jgi:4-amino-4-deoxychorismate lyase
MSAHSSVLVDGVRAECFPVDDRGLMYGDGVFRTLRVAGGRPRWWHEQLAKLAEDCAQLGLTMPDVSHWQADLDLLAPCMSDGVMKLIVTRGSGPRGYLPPASAKPRRLMRYDATASQPIPPTPTELTIRVCSLRLGQQPRLAGIKHLNRLENVLARAEWNATDIHEGLLLDQAERVISGVMSNLFIWRDQGKQSRLLTPRLDQCGVAGVARARLMRLARAQGLQVEEAVLSLQDVFDADEVMLTNSVSGLRRVARLESKTWPVPLISPRLAALLDA